MIPTTSKDLVSGKWIVLYWMTKTNYITEKIPIWLAEGRKDLSDSQSIWDWMKYNIRAHTIQLSKRKAQERNEREQHLQEEYAKAKFIFETDPNDRNANTLNSAKDTLELFHEEKVKGIIICARAHWHEHGEKSMKYFLNLEKRNHIKKHMRKLNINGSISSDPFNILNEQWSFYQELHTSRNLNNKAIKSFLKDLLIPKLSEEQKMSCEGKMTSEECALLLECFHTPQFFEACWWLIKGLMMPNHLQGGRKYSWNKRCLSAEIRSKLCFINR